MRELERNVLLRSVDTRWMDHIDAMDRLRDGIGLRAYAQRDPVNEYKMESYDMFDEMVRLLQEDSVRALYQLRIEKAPERREVAKPMRAVGAGDAAPSPRPGTQQIKKGEKVGRNSPCPCGSGKKYKNCHGANS
ncbi:Protein translocase subunit SecA [bioreactor metagenome]|uniref:Protein translocase subunit SecA n=1 Tax=bioreactor metagenome TaxID=1076179 RepID=A0A645HJK6_9ZZZZ